MLTVESPCGIEPQSLANENLTIRPWRFTPTEAVFSFSCINFLILIFSFSCKKAKSFIKNLFWLAKKRIKSHRTPKKSINRRQVDGGGWGRRCLRTYHVYQLQISPKQTNYPPNCKIQPLPTKMSLKKWPLEVRRAFE